MVYTSTTHNDSCTMTYQLVDPNNGSPSLLRTESLQYLTYASYEALNGTVGSPRESKKFRTQRKRKSTQRYVYEVGNRHFRRG